MLFKLTEIQVWPTEGTRPFYEWLKVMAIVDGVALVQTPYGPTAIPWRDIRVRGWCDDNKTAEYELATDQS